MACSAPFILASEALYEWADKPARVAYARAKNEKP